MRSHQVDPGNRAEASFRNRKIWNVLQYGVLVSLAALVSVLLNGCAGLANGTTGNPPSTLEITNVQTTSPTTSSAQILGKTNVAADSAVNYGPTPSYGLSTPVDSAMVTNHKITLSGLAAGTTYYYQVSSTDSKGNHGNSGGHGFKTSGFSISGTISPATGGSGTILTLGGAANATTTADSSGSYTFVGLPNGTYTIVPSHAGFTFTPTSQTATVNGANVTGVNFTDAAASATPTITTQPASQTVTVGQKATFTVVATGTAPLSYQWSKKGTAIAGATASSYTTPVTTSSDNGSSFVVVVSNSAGKVTSSAATLTVNAAGSTGSFSPTSLAFGNQTVGTSSSAQFATFTNTGSGTLTFGTEPITGDFALAGQGTCSTSLAVGASCTLSIRFTPTATGTRTGTLTVNDNASTSPQVVTLTGMGVSSTPPPTGLFGHVAIVVEENTNYSGVSSSSMPYLSGLMSQYGLATQYYANTHPSIGNYLMLTTGQVLTNNESDAPGRFPVSADNVVRELVAAGKTWKAYGESLPSVGYLGGDSTSGGGQYYVRHVPIAYLTDLQNSSTQQQNLVPFTHFASDLAAGNLPNYSFITPHRCDDAHDCCLTTAPHWLQTNIDPLIKNTAFQKDGLLIVVFDESGSDNTNGGGRVVCALISPAFTKLGHQSTNIYQHQSLLRLALEGLGIIVFPGAASTAADMGEFFNTSGTTPPPPSPLAVATTRLPNGTVGQAYSTQMNATGGTSLYTWSASSGSLPAGLSLSSAGVISGTPTPAESSTFTATVRDASSQTASSSFTLAVTSLTSTGCTLYVSPSGSDSNAGTLFAPWRTPQKAARSAAAGQTGCFRACS